jgi:adenylyl/guanylyl cyclase-like protein with sensor domain/cyclic GMP-AMP synthase DncV-like protein
MEELTQNQISEALEKLADSLDISPSKYREAVRHYKAVGEWLDADDSPLKGHGLNIYPQGSFRIGTVIRPVKEGKVADYDIDLVCQLSRVSSSLTAKDLKLMVGERLKEHGTYRKLLDEEGRRCWTLRYAESDGIGFHLDALPALAEGATIMAGLVDGGVEFEYAQHAVAITERTASDSHLWVEGGSNPAGFALWFESINGDAVARVAFIQKQMLYESNGSLFASVQDVPDALVRTPLQRAIQLLKRHRDVRFLGQRWEDEKPISMIITTLAARAYRGEADLITALRGILTRINDYATTGVLERRDGEWWVPNPVNPGENFADRWNQRDSHRAEAFFEWMSWVQQDLALAEEQDSATKRRSVIAEAFGVSESTLGTTQETGAIVTVPKETVPALASSSHRQEPQWPVREERRVSVAASIRRSRNASRPLWQLSTRPVPKNHWLRFQASTNASEPYEVHWQVVNTGSEASNAGSAQLRGGFEEGEGSCGSVRWESTAYRGTHWVEAFVVKDGVCVARSGPVYVRVR